MEVKKIVEGMTAQQVAQVIDDNFKAQNKILGDDIATQNSVIGVSEYKDFSEAEAGAVGDVRKYNGFLYECVEATTGAFDASKWKKSSFKNETEKKLSELGSEVGAEFDYVEKEVNSIDNVSLINKTLDVKSIMVNVAELNGDATLFLTYSVNGEYKYMSTTAKEGRMYEFVLDGVAGWYGLELKNITSVGLVKLTCYYNVGAFLKDTNNNIIRIEESVAEVNKKIENISGNIGNKIRPVKVGVGELDNVTLITSDDIGKSFGCNIVENECGGTLFLTYRTNDGYKYDAVKAEIGYQEFNIEEEFSWYKLELRNVEKIGFIELRIEIGVNDYLKELSRKTVELQKEFNKEIDDIRSSVNSENVELRPLWEKEKRFVSKNAGEDIKIVDQLNSALAIIPYIDGISVDFKGTARLYIPAIMYVDGNMKSLGVDLVTNSNGVVEVSKTLNPPIGTKYIYVNVSMNEPIYTDENINKYCSIKMEGVSFLSYYTYFNDVNDFNKGVGSYVKNEIESSCWFGKNIWWCGTSIPAATDYWVENPRSYPKYVGKILKASYVYNEAVGSSHARSFHTKQYGSILKAMGMSVQEKMQYFSDLWIVDDVSQTFSDGPRLLGVSDIPSVSSYKDVCDIRKRFVLESYQVKLQLRYLISDEMENANFFRGLVGDDLAAKLKEQYPNTFNYQADIDLFVIDHSNNDWEEFFPTDNIGNEDMATFEGAINTYIRLILRYKGHARIVLIGNYVDMPNGINELISEIGNYWQIPVFQTSSVLPFKNETEVYTSGYWDDDKVWHNEGFSYLPSSSSDSFETNLSLKCAARNGITSKTQFESRCEPKNIDGRMCWKTSTRNIWLYDGLHPHANSDTSVLVMYAQSIAGYLKNIGNSSTLF